MLITRGFAKIKNPVRTGGDQTDQGVKTRIPSSRVLWCLAAGGNLMLIGRTNRRDFIAALGGTAAWPLVARGQEPYAW